METTHAIALKVGGKHIVSKLVDDIKDDNESYRKLVMETIQRIVEDVVSALPAQLFLS